LINYTKEEKIKIKKIAKARLIERKTKSSNEFNRKGLTKFIEEINSNEANSILISESKQIALEDYFKSLVDFELSLELLVKEKLISHSKDLYIEVGKMINLQNE
jgi:UTP-glucose-1-phosphate uridylyltransferase